MVLQRGCTRWEGGSYVEVYARIHRGSRYAIGSAGATTEIAERISSQACPAYYNGQRSIKSDKKDVLIPLPILKFMKYPGKVEILLEMLNRLLSLDISRSPSLVGMDVIPPD
jgi:hypothetical protein